MVGETSILSAAGRRFLENVPGVRFAEGSYGRFLLTGDIVRRPVQFGCRGKGKPLPGLGWGIEVQPERLRAYAGGVIDIPF
jgi:L-Ala-D/L-Glu epimerase